MPVVKCFLCGAKTYKRPYNIKKAEHIFCSLKCSGEYRTKTQSEIRKCVICGKNFKVKNGDIKRRMALCCSRNCLKKWWVNNKTTSIGVDGYERFGKERKHRAVIERFIGRKLKRAEVVHHINGIKTDNRIENLALMSQSEHMKIHYPSLKEKLHREIIYTKKCGICSKEFNTKSHRAIYCSPHCVYVSRKDYYKKWEKKRKKI